MAVATGALRRRRNEEKRIAAKSKRDKLILGVGGVLLVLVLAFEIPKLMSSSSSGSSTPAPAPATAVPPTAAATGAPSPEVIRADLRQIAKLPPKDPFQAQLGADTAVSTTTQPFTHGPRVRASHFVGKDPFKVQIGAPANAAPAAPLATPPTVSTTKATHKSSTSATASSGYIVILRSLDSKAAAQQEVKKAHAHGLSGASILYSSKYTTLRHGYWVVYLSRYATVAAANSGLQDARAHGYGSAYRRPVKK